MPEGQSMKQKYVISRSDDNTNITITESSEVDKEVFAQLCSETFLVDELPASPDASPKELISTFRTQNMFPPIDYAVRIADSLSELLADDARRIIEVKIDDKAEITARREARETLLKEKELPGPGGG
jgi:hypothetical protein